MSKCPGCGFTEEHDFNCRQEQLESELKFLKVQQETPKLSPFRAMGGALVFRCEEGPLDSCVSFRTRGLSGSIGIDELIALSKWADKAATWLMDRGVKE